MGTRADFYVKGGDELEWLGSIAWDGYPDGIDGSVLAAETEADFRAQLAKFAEGRDDWTAPERGWPWPWDDSDTTDYAYVFVPEIGVVHKLDASGDGPDLYVKTSAQMSPDPSWVWDDDWGHAKNAAVQGVSYTYPDMRARKAVTLGLRSGVIVVGGQS